MTHITRIYTYLYNIYNCYHCCTYIIYIINIHTPYILLLYIALISGGISVGICTTDDVCEM